MNHIYFIFQKNIPNKCKIGYSGDPVDRCINLQTGNPNQLSIYRYIETQKPKKVEKYIHSQLKMLNIKGEWFMVSRKMVDHIISTTDFDNLKLKEKEKPKILSAQCKPIMSNKIYQCDLCKKIFKHRASYWKHTTKKKTSCITQEECVKLSKELYNCQSKLQAQQTEINWLKEIVKKEFKTH